MRVRIRESAVIEAPVAEVWAILRDFEGHHRWHPAIAASAMEDGAATDQVGGVRRFSLPDGGVLRERLLAHSDAARAFSYALLEAPLPLMGYVAHVRLRPVTSTGATFWEWWSAFDAPDLRAEELRALVAGGIYRAGFAAIAARLAPAVPTSLPGRHGDPGLGPATIATGAPGTGTAAPEAATRPADPARAPARSAPPRQVQAFILSRHGGPDALAPRDLPLPAPGPGEVLLRHEAIGLNAVDLQVRRGEVALSPPGAVPGVSAAGVVEALGPGVAGLGVGARVAYAARGGAMAAWRVLPAAEAVRVPDGLAPEVAAALLVRAVMAHHLVRLRPARLGEVALVRGAGGGLGPILVALARAQGAAVIGTARSPAGLAAARAAGADAAIDEAEDVAARARALTGARGSSSPMTAWAPRPWPARPRAWRLGATWWRSAA